jgi:glycosyltransferase involved in cell wall biosynthesis
MRIAMIGTRGLGTYYGGIERCLDELCPRLAAMGHEVDVYAQLDSPASTVPGMRNLPTRSFGGKHLSNISRSVVATSRAAGRYDVLHFHATGPGILSAVTRVAGQPSVVTVHALDQQREKWGVVAKTALSLAERALVHNASQLTVVSENLRRYFRGRYDVPVDLVPNGYPAVEPVPPGDLLARHGLAPKSYILFASRLMPEKGCHDLINAFNSTPTPLKLVIAGGNGAQDYIEQMRALADPARTVFVGHLQGGELREIFSNAHTFVLPSYIEGMSLALLEAIAYSLPLIVSDIPENKLVVGAAPVCFPAGDVAALSQAIAARSADGGSGAVVDASRIPRWDEVATRYVRIYEQAAARRPLRTQVRN